MQSVRQRLPAMLYCSNGNPQAVWCIGTEIDSSGTNRVIEMDDSGLPFSGTTSNSTAKHMDELVGA